MSDQDFFFEDEETETTDDKAAKTGKPGDKPAAKTGSSATKSTSKPVAKGSSTSSAAAAKKAVAAKAAAPAPSFFDQTVTVAIASLLAIVGLLLGVIIGYFVFSGGTQASTTPTGSFTQPSTTGTGTGAPPLTQDQLNSGQLPQGHPKIGGSTTATPTK